MGSFDQGGFSTACRTLEPMFSTFPQFVESDVVEISVIMSHGKLLLDCEKTSVLQFLSLTKSYIGVIPLGGLQ